MVASASAPTAAKATGPKRAASSRAPINAGASRSDSSKFDTPKKRLVSSGPIGANESDAGSTSIDTAYAASTPTTAKPSADLLRRNRGPHTPPATQQTPTRATRGPASPLGSQPSARFAARDAPSAVGAPRGKKKAKHTSRMSSNTEVAIVVLRATWISSSTR